LKFCILWISALKPTVYVVEHLVQRQAQWLDLAY
jgi:hypothetical protein